MRNRCTVAASPVQGVSRAVGSHCAASARGTQWMARVSCVVARSDGCQQSRSGAAVGVPVHESARARRSRSSPGRVCIRSSHCVRGVGIRLSSDHRPVAWAATAGRFRLVGIVARRAVARRDGETATEWKAIRVRAGSESQCPEWAPPELGGLKAAIQGARQNGVVDRLHIASISMSGMAGSGRHGQLLERSALARRT